MAATVRLSPELQTRATIYASRVGISVNALLAVSLLEYLNLREGVPTPEVAISAPQARSHGSGGSSGSPRLPEARREPPARLTRQQRRLLKREAAKRDR